MVDLMELWMTVGSLVKLLLSILGLVFTIYILSGRIILDITERCLTRITGNEDIRSRRQNRDSRLTPAPFPFL